MKVADTVVGMVECPQIGVQVVDTVESAVAVAVVAGAGTATVVAPADKLVVGRLAGALPDTLVA